MTPIRQGKQMGHKTNSLVGGFIYDVFAKYDFRCYRSKKQKQVYFSSIWNVLFMYRGMPGNL